jgi:L-ascorbate metabolism protein UlaG (beta-lactamase superfamily)
MKSVGWIVAVAAVGGLALVSMSSCSSTYYEGPVTGHFDGQTFSNAGPPRPNSAWDFWRWQVTREPGPWPEWVDNETMDKPPARVEGDELRVSYINHATVLMQTQGLNILTDPIWSDRASPVSFAGPKRVRAPGVRFEDLPKIDVVLVSHNHYDHMDVVTLEKIWLRDQPRIITPLGNDTIIRSQNKSIRVEVVDLAQSLELAPNVRTTLEPMQHWSARTRWDTNRALWGSFVIQASGGAIYFVGDAGYGGGVNYRNAAQKYGGFRFTLMPIGAYQPQWFMAYSHQTPEEAVQGHLDSQSCYTLATQHSTFPMADDGYEEPLRDLAFGRQKLGVVDDTFKALMNGQHWNVPSVTITDGKMRCAPG